MIRQNVSYALAKSSESRYIFMYNMIQLCLVPIFQVSSCKVFHRVWKSAVENCTLCGFPCIVSYVLDKVSNVLLFLLYHIIPNSVHVTFDTCTLWGIIWYNKNNSTFDILSSTYYTIWCIKCYMYQNIQCIKCTYLFPGFYDRLRRVTFLEIISWQEGWRRFF